MGNGYETEDRGIRLHPEHGLNPSMDTCIICGKPTGAILLMGAACKGQAPMNVVSSIEPCRDCCKKYLEKGTMLAEGDKTKGPTGRMMVITDEDYKRMFDKDPPKSKIVMADMELFKILTDAQETQAKEAAAAGVARMNGQP